MTDVLVFSDFHLSDAAHAPDPARADDAWMRFRDPRLFVDAEFAALADRILADRTRADRLLDERDGEKDRGGPGEQPFEVVFNGDVFEVDGTLAWGRRTPLRAPIIGAEDAEVEALDRILTDHAVFVEAVGRLLAQARRVVFLSGNHDIGLYWPKAQRLLRRRLAQAARRAGADSPAAVLRERVVFRPWFHRVEGVYIEHGMQYDPSSALLDPLVPTRGDGAGLWLSRGSLTFRHLMGHIGTMNPHNHESYLLGWRGTLRHWLRYYVRRGRALFLPLFPGWARLVWHAWRQRHPRCEPALPERERALVDQLDATDCAPTTLHRLRALHEPPAARRESGLYRFLRLFGVDRLLVAGLLATLALVATLALPHPHDFVVTFVLGVLLWAYSRFAPKSGLFSYEQTLPDVAAEIAQLTGDRVVVFGHTHHAGVWTLDGGARSSDAGPVLLNTGTWANGFADPECRIRVNAARTFARIRTGEAGTPPDAQLLEWRDGAIVPFDAETATIPAVTDPWEDEPLPAA